MSAESRSSFPLYSTCPPSNGADVHAFQRRVASVGSWADAHGIEGLLIYTDNTLMDPWLTAQLLISHTVHCVPLVAVQPVYMHPFAAAKVIASLILFAGRRVDLNLVTGGFAGDLATLSDKIGHDARYARLTEYGRIIELLLTSERPINFAGEFYQLRRAVLCQRPEPDMLPGVYVSGSSGDSVATSAALSATRLAYCGAPSEYADGEALRGTGVRIGIIARDTHEEAWTIAVQRFPPERGGEQLHDVAARRTESVWHREMSQRAYAMPGTDSVYWLYPFRVYKTFCPYLVGDHDEVTTTLEEYLRLGVRCIILDTPEEEADFLHAKRCVAEALSRQRLGPGETSREGAPSNGVFSV